MKGVMEPQQQHMFSDQYWLIIKNEQNAARVFNNEG